MSEHDSISVVIFAEDPGSANFVADLPARLTISGIHNILLGVNHAIGFFRGKSVEVLDLTRDIKPKEVMDRYKPKLLLAGTSQNRKSFGLDLIDAAKESNVGTIGFVDTSADAEFRFSGTSDLPLYHAPDWLVVPDNETFQIFKELGFQSDCIRVIGNPNYDRVLELKKKFAAEDPAEFRKRVLPGTQNRYVVVFVAEHLNSGDPRMFRSPGYTLHGRGKCNSRTAIVLEEVLDVCAALEQKPYFVVRMHPKSGRDEFEAYLEEIDLLSSGGDPLELIWTADLVVGMNSMLLLEAMLLEKPVLSVLPRKWEEVWSPKMLLESAHCVTSREELKAELYSILSRESQDMISYDFARLAGACDRFVEFIKERLRAVEN